MKILDKYYFGHLSLGEEKNPLPLGIMPKKLFYENIQRERFEQLCRVITEYFNRGEKIKVEWIEEYNELIENFKKESRNDDN
jgi:hypothetical protein